MEHFKKKITFNAIFSLVGCMILAVISFLAFDTSVGFVLGIGQHGYRSFISGAACGMAIAYAIDAIRCFLALGSEGKLKKLYVKDTDERVNQISLSAQSAASQLMLRLKIVAIFVASYVNLTVGLTILACACAHALCILGFKAYYRWKY